MATHLHDLSLAELNRLSRQLGGPTKSHKRSELFGFLLEFYDYDNDDPLAALYELAASGPAIDSSADRG